MTGRNPALEAICQRIARDVGILNSNKDEILDLASRAGMDMDDIWNRPAAVAAEIGMYLDDIARDP